MNRSVSCTGIIIDDDVEFVEVMEEICRLNDIEILGKGYDGNTAVELVKTYSPNFVLLDYKLPKKDGISAAKEIRDISPNTKIILLTGFIEEINKLPENIDKILTKPYPPKKLIKDIKDISCS